MRSNNYYVKIIEIAQVYESSDKSRIVKSAVNTLKNRTIKAYESGVITADECNEVLKWLNNVRRWYGLKLYELI